MDGTGWKERVFDDNLDLLYELKRGVQGRVDSLISERDR